MQNIVSTYLGTAKRDVELTTIFLHNPTGNVLLVQAQVVVTRWVIAPRQAAP